VGAWAWTARAWEIWCCHPPDGTRRRGMARRLLEGKGRREHGKGWRNGYTAVRDGAALRRWTGATARRLHDGEGWRGATAMGCGDGSSKAREGASAARDGATATQRRGTARHLCAGKKICHHFER
jgi:hypothetical protein